MGTSLREEQHSLPNVYCWKMRSPIITNMSVVNQKLEDFDDISSDNFLVESPVVVGFFYTKYDDLSLFYCSK